MRVGLLIEVWELFVAVLGTGGRGQRGVSEDTKMNNCECREGPVENAYVQGPEFCATPLGKITKLSTSDKFPRCSAGGSVLCGCM